MKYLIILLTGLIIVGCSGTKSSAENTAAQAQIIIYKTSKDYMHNVPVTLNNDKEKIVSYPHPNDLYNNGELALPVKLNKGYLYDRRGLSSNSVFTSFTYEEYSSLKNPPSLEDLMDSVIDMDPFSELYVCGNKGDYKNLINDLNKVIKKGFTDCQRLK